MEPTFDYTAEWGVFGAELIDPVTAITRCCRVTYQKDGVFGPYKVIAQIGLSSRQRTNEYDEVFKARIVVDDQSDIPVVTIETRLFAINSTNDTEAYPGTVEIPDAELQRLVEKIPAAIEHVWNAQNLRLVVTDHICGERRFRFRFQVRFVSSQDRCHYSVRFVNCGRSANFLADIHAESYVETDTYRAVFNMGDPRSVARSSEPGLEAHEYGHMLGLLDEYESEDADIAGCDYLFPHGVREEVRAGRGLMGRGIVRSASFRGYFLPLANAVRAILQERGHIVTALHIM